MPRPLISIDMIHFADLRAKGYSIPVIAQILGINKSTLFSKIKKSGFDIGKPITKKQSIFIDIEIIIHRYQCGDSILAIANDIGVSRSVITNRLKTNDVAIRSQLEANRIMMSKRTPEENKRNCEEANKAIFGKKQSIKTLVKRASTQSKCVGFGEIEIITELTNRGYQINGQTQCGKYNIDITVGNSIAVEICYAAGDRSRNPIFIERAKYLRDNGYTVIIVSFKNRESFIGNFNDVISLIERTHSLPPCSRKDRMIRCTFNRFSRGRNNLGQITSVPSPIRFFNIVSEWYF